MGKSVPELGCHFDRCPSFNVISSIQCRAKKNLTVMKGVDRTFWFERSSYNFVGLRAEIEAYASSVGEESLLLFL